MSKISPTDYLAAHGLNSLLSKEVEAILHNQPTDPVTAIAERLKFLGRFSPAQREYLAGFAPEHSSDPFVTCYTVAPDKSLTTTSYTRGEFFALALKACRVLREAGVEAGECHTHFFSCNTLGDLAFRLASVLCGTTPVTINWQADTPDRVLYKVEVTKSKLLLYDDETPPDVLAMIAKERPSLVRVDVATLTTIEPLPLGEVGGKASVAATSDDATRIVIFTSGTTGNPKGVQLSYRAYRCNKKTFESFLDCGESKRLIAIVVNPMHHTNSTAITDWCLRTPRATLHLIQRYTTQYWSVIARAGTSLSISAKASDTELTSAITKRHADGKAVIVCPLVSRHFDFLDGLWSSGLPLAQGVLHLAMSKTILLLGSAPVGPTTVNRLQKYAGKLPTVRFGSTETCLQVMGTPLYLSEAERLRAYEAGWKHSYNGQEQVGYYIGRPHPPYTECRIVKSITPDTKTKEYEDCADGEPGQLLTRGANLMSGYVGNADATKKALSGPGGWYTNLGDVCFRLKAADGFSYDYYWLSRDSALLIRGGANYAYEQINAELHGFVVEAYGLKSEQVEVAVLGMRVKSEHEDDCCVTIELIGEEALSKSGEIEESFLEKAKKGVSKGAKPDRVRIGPLPRNFKGVVKLPDLKEEWGKILAK